MSRRYGCAVLAGGAGSRMGHTNKAAIEYNGRSFLDLICAEMKISSGKCYLSAANYEQDLPDGWILVRDIVTTDDGEFIGPIGGIYSCLVQARKDGLDGLFFAPCDAPLYSSAVIEKMLAYIDSETDAVCWKTSDGRVQTTFGWYSVKCIDVLEKDIHEGKYKLLRSLDKVRCKTIETSEADLMDRCFMNINCAVDFHNLTGETENSTDPIGCTR